MKDSHELARLCTLDLGREVTSDDVRGYLLVGAGYLTHRFSADEISDIGATLIKELDADGKQRG